MRNWSWPMWGLNPRSRGCEAETLSIRPLHQLLICWHVQIYVRGMLGISCVCNKHTEICQCLFLYAETKYIFFWTCSVYDCVTIAYTVRTKKMWHEIEINLWCTVLQWILYIFKPPFEEVGVFCFANGGLVCRQSLSDQ